MTTEETGRVATEVAKGLSRNPLILGAMVFNALILGVLFFMVRDAADRNDVRFKMAMDACVEKK